jgi:predicted amidohydrolase YtcJ
MMKKGILSIIPAVFLLVGCESQTSLDVAESVFVNGNIYTSDVIHPTVSAVAIRDGRFVYVGDDPSEHIGPETTVFDLGGRTAIPGIIDAHSHPGWVALSGNLALLEDTSSKESLMASIEKMLAESSSQDVVIGGFWPNALFGVDGPTRQELDNIESERPVILYDDWAHTVWANTRALEHAGVDAQTKDVAPGFAFFQRDEDGQATGWITESAATLFVNKFQNVTPDVEDDLLEYLNYYRSVGVTTVLDAGNFGLDRDIYAAISRLDKKGLLPVRYHGAYTLFVPDDWTTAVETLQKLGKDFNSENVRIDTLKIFFDGVLETRTASLSEDYLDTPGNRGGSLLTRQQVHKLILQLDAAGLNLHMHAVGDRATTTLLDAIQDAHDSLARAPAISIAICHLEIVKQTDIPRFKQLGVIANFTPHWWIGGDLSWNEQGIGDKAGSMQRGRSFINSGAVVSFSSDITDRYEWKRDRANPFLGMEMAHNRQDVGAGKDSEIFPPEDERVDRADLLAGYTVNGGLQLGRPEDIGQIAVGRLADLVILDQDPLKVDRYQIHKTKPIAVLMNGKLVHGSVPDQE